MSTIQPVRRALVAALNEVGAAGVARPRQKVQPVIDKFSPEVAEPKLQQGTVEFVRLPAVEK